MSTVEELRSDFLRLHGAEPRIFRAPGRVNLIGEHTDYNGGFVMPAAIGLATRAAVASRSDRVIDVYSRNYPESVAFDLDEANPAPQGHWSDYVRGVCIVFEQRGHRLRGANLVIDGEVPVGSGLSSSAALEVATALALRENSFLEVGLTESSWVRAPESWISSLPATVARTMHCCWIAVRSRCATSRCRIA
jgi:galactokinase